MWVENTGKCILACTCIQTRYSNRDRWKLGQRISYSKLKISIAAPAGDAVIIQHSTSVLGPAGYCDSSWEIKWKAIVTNKHQNRKNVNHNANSLWHMNAWIELAATMHPQVFSTSIQCCSAAEKRSQCCSAAEKRSLEFDHDVPYLFPCCENFACLQSQLVYLFTVLHHG
jgi:hypothetical protein